MGEIMCHTIRSDVFDEIVVHKFEDSAAQDVELAIQSRDMTTAYSRVINLSRAQRKEGQLMATHENELINLCTVRPPMKPESWAKANPALSVDDSMLIPMMTAFKKDLEEYSYCMPPRFSEFTQWTKDVSILVK